MVTNLLGEEHIDDGGPFVHFVPSMLPDAAPRARPTVDLLTLGPRDRDVWDQGYATGYSHGHDSGWAAADEHAAVLHRTAHRVVQKMATYPTHEAIQRQRRGSP